MSVIPSSILAAGVAAVTALATAGCQEPPPADRIRASGHVEVTEVRLAPEAGGRVVALDVTEGARILQGARVLALDARDVELSIDRARAELAQAEAQVRLLRAGSRPEDIRQAEAQAEAARAELQAAEAELVGAEQDLDRFEQLLQKNSGTRKQRDDAATRRDVARARVAGAADRIRAAQEAVARARAGARREEIEAAEARVATVRAQIASLEKALGDTTLVSPVAGVVTEKLVEVGEMLAPRTPAVVIADLDHAWADVYVPEPVVPRITLGQEATVYTDAGGPGIKGIVTYVSPKAEFTPRNVQTADERSKLVYRIRVTVDNAQGVLKQGMPVEADVPLTPVS
jgi:HlyD family secretion protein